MKVIYKAEDGTEFDKESNCKDYENSLVKESKHKQLIEFVNDKYRSEGQGSVSAFIIENIQEINKILCFYKTEEVVYMDSYSAKFKAVSESSNTICRDCAFDDNYVECRKSKEYHNCITHSIIWIKK